MHLSRNSSIKLSCHHSSSHSEHFCILKLSLCREQLRSESKQLKRELKEAKKKRDEDILRKEKLEAIANQGTVW